MPPKKFIPGLNSRPDDIEMPPKQPEKTDLDYLVDDFIKQRKNAAMCLHEYCQKKKLSLKFKEGNVQFRPGQPRTSSSFGCSAIVEELQYPQGVGSTKKEAKIDASRLCLRAILGMDDFTPEEITPDHDDNRYIEVRDLVDVCVKRDVHYVKMMNLDQNGAHTCTIYLSNHDPIKHSSTHRETAVVRAHREALRILEGQPSTDGPIDLGYSTDNVDVVRPPRIPIQTEAMLREEEVFAALHRTLQTLLPEVASFEHHVAAIFVSNQNVKEFIGLGQIVAFGTGESTLGAEYLTPDGRCVVDSSAATTARRAFKRYLGHEMAACFSGGISIFEPNPQNPSRLKLKGGFEFHLYLSHAPSGDYKQFLPVGSNFSHDEEMDIANGAHIPNFTDERHGLFTCSNEHGAIQSSDTVPYASSQEEVRQSRSVWVMSVSDKLLSWNILGLQGAAYSHFIEPIYLKDISFGYHLQIDHGHMCRAVCCRVFPDLAASFPPPYCINHPVLTLIRNPYAKLKSHPGNGRSPYSINWSKHDSKAELTDGLTGRSNPASPFQVSVNLVSRQCKAGLHLKWFRDLCKLSPIVPSDKSPAEIKAMAQDYQTVKAAFFQHCVENNIGKWVQIPQGPWTLKK